MKKRFLASVLALCMVLTLLPIRTLAANETSGTIYLTDIAWEFDASSGTLTLSGTGRMPNRGLSQNKPWQSHINDITHIVVESGITRVGSYAFYLCRNANTITLSDTVESIDKYAFSNCNSLQTIDIPTSVIDINTSAFNNCLSLKSINVSPNNSSYTSYGDGALYTKDLTAILFVPYGLSGIFSVPNGVQEIGANAFHSQGNISEVILPNSITKIGVGAFQGSNISSINIPQNVTEIGESAFMYCDNLTKMNIPASVTDIGKWAFYASSNRPIREIYFAGDAPAFGENCFNNAGITVYYPTGNLSWTDDIMLNYGGEITWTPWNPDTGDVETTYSVSYNLAGGSGEVPSTQNYKAGETVTLSSITPVRDGYTFTGWSDGNRTYQAEQMFTMPEMDVSLTAQWTQNQAGGSKINTGTWKNTSASIASKEAVTTGQILQVYDAISENISPNVAQRIYNLLFIAQYRPTAIGGSYWNHLNGQSYVYSVHDSGLNKEVYFWGSTGCLSYAKFAEKYILQDGGGSYKKLETVPSKTDDIKEFFDLNASPGEEMTFRHDLSGYHIHSVTYLTHDDDGFYFLSYPGGKSTDSVSLYFCEWGKFQGILKKYDGYCIKINNVVEGGLGKNISGQLNCPVELEISYNNEVLASQGQNGKITASFGYLEATGKPEDRSIIFSLDYHPDYQIRLSGTADGYADFKLEFTFDNDSTCYREYKGIPISATTRIEITPTIINSDIALYVYNGNNDTLSSCWCAGIDETVLAPREDLLISINGGAAIDDDIITTPAIITFDGVTTMTTNEDGILYSLPTPTRSGYTFNGWYTADGTRITTNTVFTEDTTIYASWSKIDTPSNPSYNNSDSSDGDPTYSITVPGRITGGTVKVTPTNTSERQRVTITTKANLGYELDELIVTDRKGNELKLTDKGDGKYTFTMPDSNVTVDVSFASIAEVPTAVVFTDVPSGAYYFDAVAWAVKKGVTSGTSATMFSPDSNCTRAQIVTFLWRAAGSPVMDGNNSFTNVASGSYYYDAVQWAVAQGITAGTSETTFSPDAACTRGQAVTFLYRAAGSPVVGGSSAFADVSDDVYYTNAVRWAVSKNVTAGTSTTTFSPDSNCTRAQIVSFLYRDRAN